MTADDRKHDPEAVPGVAPKTEAGGQVASVTLEVDGEVFAVHPNQHGGSDYDWVSGPNPGYGFGVSPTRDLSLDGHRANIRDFLADIDPSTGYLRED